jgi:hypothetical protein
VDEHLQVLMPVSIGQVKITHEKRTFSVDSLAARLTSHAFFSQCPRSLILKGCSVRHRLSQEHTGPEIGSAVSGG